MLVSGQGALRGGVQGETGISRVPATGCSGLCKALVEKELMEDRNRCFWPYIKLLLSWQCSNGHASADNGHLGSLEPVNPPEVGKQQCCFDSWLDFIQTFPWI